MIESDFRHQNREPNLVFNFNIDHKEYIGFQIFKLTLYNKQNLKFKQSIRDAQYN